MTEVVLLLRKNSILYFKKVHHSVLPMLSFQTPYYKRYYINDPSNEQLAYADAQDYIIIDFDSKIIIDNQCLIDINSIKDKRIKNFEVIKIF